MSSIPILILRLEGVLQSWGEHSKWGYRDSASLPTKSGVIGLLGCALGIPREDTRLIDLHRRLKIAIRADRAGIPMVDFHTIRSQYLLDAQGKLRGNIGEYSTLLSHRTYLQDAYFTIAITGDDELLHCLVEALNKPKWPIYLGRKSCVPSRPVYDGLSNQYKSLEQAIQEIPSPETGQMIIETEAVHGDTTIERRDISIGNRVFRSRSVTRKIIRKERVKGVSE